MKLRIAAGLALVGTLGLAFGLSALSPAGAQPAPQPTPSPIVVPTLPPTDATTQAILRAAAGIVNDAITRNRINAANTTHGNVTYFRRFDMQVQTGPNGYRNVRLHQGTVINPRGATPAAGATVDVNGTGAPDGTLDADTITVIR